MHGCLVEAESAPLPFIAATDLSEFALPSALRTYREAARSLMNE
jgi:hypothetical protein